ncbi:MAG: hypothetical protein IJZ13_08085, partial [Clostridia bacterium]|nr:hypothetical protein [Clostridia bacterium]
MKGKTNAAIRGMGAALLAGLLLAGVLTACSGADPLRARSEPESYTYTDTNPAPQGAAPAEGMETVAAVGGNTLFFDPETTRFAVKTAAGAVWYSTLSEEEADADDMAAGPFRRAMTSWLTVYACDNTGALGKEYSCWRDSVQAGAYTVRYMQDEAGTPVGVRVDFTFESISTTVPVTAVLTPSGLQAAVLLDEVIAEDPEYVITDMNLLPHFGSGSPEEEGYLLVPDGSGSIIAFNNGKTSSGSFEIKLYDRDPVFSADTNEETMEPARLPVFGICRGEAAMLAIIESGDALADVVAEPSGVSTTRNFVYSRYNLREMGNYAIKDISGSEVSYTVLDTDPHTWPDIQVAYRFLEGEQATYSGMAAVYGAYLAEAHALTERDTASAPAMMLDLYGAVEKKEPVVGIPMNVTKPLTTFDQAADMLAELGAGGATALTVRYKYLTADKIGGKNDNALSPVGKLGGKRGFTRLLDSLGTTTVYVAVNPVVTEGAFLKKDGAYIQDVMGLSAYQYRYDIATGEKIVKDRYYLLVPQAVRKAVEALAGDWAWSDRANAGLCVEYLGENLYSSYGSYAYTREDTKLSWQTALETAAKAAGSVMVEGGNAYALPYCDTVADAPMTSNGYAVTDYAVPFYQMALSRYLVISGSPINLNSNPRTQLLRCFETGSIPHFALIAEEPSVLQQTELQGLFGVDYSLWKEDILAAYAAYAALAEATAGSPLTAHRQVAQGVAQALGCTAEAQVIPGYAALVNDEGEAARIRRVAADLLGEETVVEKPAPSMGGEDFSF